MAAHMSALSLITGTFLKKNFSLKLLDLNLAKSTQNVQRYFVSHCFLDIKGILYLEIVFVCM